MYRNTILFASLSIALFALLGFAMYKEENPEWKSYQKEYNLLLAEKAGDPKLANLPLGLKQNWNSVLNRIDRCTTCHMGVSNTKFFADAKQPYKAHSFMGEGEFMRKHPFEKFGCTICHQGDPQANSVERTHGFVDHVDRQPLTGIFVYSSCSKCHTNLYAPDVDFKEAPVLMNGKALVMQKGCGGCHTIKQMGYGGILAPELSAFGTRTELAFHLVHDFSHVENPVRSMKNWEWEHFKNPQKITPGNPHATPPQPPTIMPNFHSTDDEATVLTVFVMSFKDKKVENIPMDYLPPPYPATVQAPAAPPAKVEPKKRSAKKS